MTDTKIIRSNMKLRNRWPCGQLHRRSHLSLCCLAGLCITCTAAGDIVCYRPANLAYPEKSAFDMHKLYGEVNLQKSSNGLTGEATGNHNLMLQGANLKGDDMK
ncbi:hypothetical protein SAY87_027633 [Trapa incisa]|nr:hypothetical protein SAY87_027633 [Trapa incisa]